MIVLNDLPAMTELTPEATDFLQVHANTPHTFMERHIFYKKVLHHNRIKIQGITYGEQVIPRELMIEALGKNFILNCDNCLYQFIGDN